MKNNVKHRIKDIIMNITLYWCLIMAFIYFIILFSIPLFGMISYLPLGEHICTFLELLFLAGIWAVPVLWLISIILMIFVRKKERLEKKERLTAVLTAVLPVVLAVFMLLTNFLGVF